MAVGNEKAATIGHSECHSKEEAQGAGRGQEQVGHSEYQQGPVLAGAEQVSSWGRLRSHGLDTSASLSEAPPPHLKKKPRQPPFP